MSENKKEIIKEIVVYGLLLLVVLGIKFFIVSPIRVNGNSMYKTLYDNDIMILNEITYRFNDIKRFDIVVIKEDDEYLIKRVIGLPGESIKCEDGKIYIDGKMLKDEFAYGNTTNFDNIILSDDEYFVLGDNRENSIDSRNYGAFDRNQIKGKANFTIYPFSRVGIKK